MGAPGGQPGPQRQHRRGPVQGLDLGLLVNADHHRVIRGCQIQTHDVANLGFQVRVGAELERLDPVRLDLPLTPDPRHRCERDAQLSSQEPGRPVRDPQPRWRAAVIGQRRHHHIGLADLRRPARPRLILQRRDPASLIPIPPADYRRPRHPHRPRDLSVRHAAGGQQHHPGTLRQPRRHARQPGQLSQPLAVTLTRDKSSSTRHAPLSRSTNRKTTFNTRH